MAEPVLQSLPWGLIFLVSDYVVVAVSLAIAYIAYRGYRRNDSPPMLAIAAGFTLAFGGPGGIYLLSLVVPIPQIVLGVITQSTETAGMVLILYGFVAPAWR